VSAHQPTVRRLGGALARGAVLAVSAAAVIAAVFASTAPAALALPPGDGDPIITCPPGYVLEDGICVKLPPPPPSNSPVVTVNTARQTTNQAAVRVAGRATDADQPATPLTVRISVDGKLVTTVTANQPDPPVASPYYATVPPPVLPGHSFDVTVPAPANAQQVCVTAVNVGATGHDTTACAQVDRVLEFRANTLTYDFANLKLTDEDPLTLDRVTNTNNTSVQQSTTVSGEKTVANTHTWSITAGTKVTFSGSAGIPLVSEGKVSLELSLSVSFNTSETTTTKFAWSQPVLVPPHSQVVATIGVAETKLTVPYALVGNYVYASGFLAPGSKGGTFTGVNGHDLEVRLDQFNLDGTPAAQPVQQPQPALLRSSLRAR
jgi:hypothetical protein